MAGAYMRSAYSLTIRRALKRYIRAHSAEKYLIYHSTLKRPCGQLIVVDDGYDLFLTLVLYPAFSWDEQAYHLEGDPEGRTFAEILVDPAYRNLHEDERWLPFLRRVGKAPEQLAKVQFRASPPA